MSLYQLLLIICAAEAISEMVYVFWMACGERLELKFSRDFSGTHGEPTAETRHEFMARSSSKKGFTGSMRV